MPGHAHAHAVILQGRTEFLEKYADVAGKLTARGFAVAALDWRGQGQSPRLVADPMLGHIEDFTTYRDDLDALLADPAVVALPGPRLLVGHSMGGAIALDWLGQNPGGGAALVLSAPMLGLHLPRPLRWLAPRIARAAVRLGRGETYVPGSGPRSYLEEGFDGNVLTEDRVRFNELADYVAANSAVALGGASLAWLRAAFAVMAALEGKAPPVPTLALLGTAEALVSQDAIRALARHEGVTLAEIPGARHEPFIETPPRRVAVWAAIDAFLAAQGLTAPAVTPPA